MKASTYLLVVQKTNDRIINGYVTLMSAPAVIQVTLSLNLKAILNLRMVQVTRHFQGNRMKVHKKVVTVTISSAIVIW
jgi:hypothetical protein